MKNSKLFAIVAIIFFAGISSAQALTRAEYQFTNGAEVVFFSTVAENPNIEQVQVVLASKNYKSFGNDLPDTVANDVACRISTHVDEYNTMKVECYPFATMGNGIAVISTVHNVSELMEAVDMARVSQRRATAFLLKTNK